MSRVEIRECDVCGKRGERSRTQVDVMFWGEFKDMNGQTYDVCQECTARLMQPMNDRAAGVSP